MVAVVHGWDGTGYRRYLSTTREEFLAWRWENAGAWIDSDIASTLTVCFVAIVPPLFYWLSTWLQEGGADTAGEAAAGAATMVRSRLAICGWLALLVFGVGLGGALATHLVVQLTGTATGFLLAGIAVVALSLPRSALPWLCRRIVAPRG